MGIYEPFAILIDLYSCPNTLSPNKACGCVQCCGGLPESQISPTSTKLHNILINYIQQQQLVHNVHIPEKATTLTLAMAPKSLPYLLASFEETQLQDAIRYQTC